MVSDTRPEPPRNTRGRRLGRIGKEELLLTFVVVVLVLLVLTPYAFDRATEPHRDRIDEVLQPARELVREVEGRLTEEVALSRGYLLTRDDQLLDAYRAVQQEQRASLDRLRPLQPQLDPATRRRVAELRSLVVARHEPVAELRRGEITAEEYVDRLSARQNLLVRTVATARGLAADLTRAEARERGSVATLRRIQNWTLLALVGLAALAVLAIGRVAVRLRRTAKEELALRRAASALNASLGIDQIARWVAGNALTIVDADGALIERLHAAGAEVEIAAAAGSVSQLRRGRLPYPGSLTPLQLEENGRRIVRRLETGSAPEPYVRQCAGCSAAVIPLTSDQGPLGALVILRDPGRGGFSELELERGDLLADLCALAMRKILLLERSQAGWSRAEHLLEARSRLVRGLSHDLKNPLGAMLGYAELLDTGVAGELQEQQRAYVRRILRAGGSMRDMLHHLLDVGRSEAEEVPCVPREVDLLRLLEDVTDEHAGEAERSGLVLRLDAPSALPTIHTDPMCLRTILGNLLSNAVKYTERGSIEVRVRGPREGAAAGDWIVLEVQDSGPGIPEPKQEEIFREFSRLEGSRSPGEGIGLANSRRMVRQLGGEIRLESRPGHGSTFSVWLPLGHGAPGG